ncbi:hypothetical protein [Pseudotabrizicola formosa]|uniref:hypothetical protein n=1 Tax=Pseudotabrizicola formosa TaxID=2030009 RepID=UPI0011AED0FC|nr:hypothetical protein [Pseudotabrizicola formosa]
MRMHLVVALGLLSTPALAQDRLYEVNDQTPLAGFNINADLADDLDVYDVAGRKIGEVEEVVGSTPDQADALVVEFEDSVADYGPEDRVIPLTAFTFDGSAMTLADGTAVQDLPVWRD